MQAAVLPTELRLHTLELTSLARVLSSMLELCQLATGGLVHAPLRLYLSIGMLGVDQCLDLARQETPPFRSSGQTCMLRFWPRHGTVEGRLVREQAGYVPELTLYVSGLAQEAVKLGVRPCCTVRYLCMSAVLLRCNLFLK